MLCSLLELIEETDIQYARQFNNDKSNHIQHEALPVVKAEQRILGGRFGPQFVVRFRFEN